MSFADLPKDVQDTFKDLDRELDALITTKAPSPVAGARRRVLSPVDREVAQLLVRKEAKDRVQAMAAGDVSLPKMTTLSDLLAEPDSAIEYRVEDLWPVGGRVLLAAQYKAGKSTLVGNLIHALVDGRPFLGQHVTRQAARVVLLDDELDERMIRRWLRAHGIDHDGNVEVVSLRGQVGSFDILDPSTRARWAALVGGADVLILDCLRPVLDALALSEDKDAGRFLVAFDALLREAGIDEGMVVHHMGHGGERSRGDSRLRDWPDVEWRIVRDGDEPTSPRYFSAFGRDVDVSEQRLDYEETTRSLTLVGGSRTAAKVDGALDALLELLSRTAEPMSGAAIEQALADQHGQKAVRSARVNAIKSGDVLVEAGARGAHLHYLNPSSSSARRSSSQLVNEVNPARQLVTSDEHEVEKQDEVSSSGIQHKKGH